MEREDHQDREPAQPVQAGPAADSLHRSALHGWGRRWQESIIAGSGVALALTLAVVAVRYADETALSPIRPPGGWRPAYVIAIVAAFVLYLAGLALVSRSTSLAAVIAVAVVIQLVPLAAPLLLSTDAYSYWDYGRIAAVHHGNPFADRPSRWPDDPAYRRMGADWRERTSVYGPAFTLAAEGDARIAGDSSRVATLLFRLLAAAGMLALVAATVVVSNGSAFAVAFVGWNPLLALHFAGGGHNDALMAVLVVLALSGLWEGAAWVAAIAVKPIAAVFLPLRVVEALRRGNLGRLVAGLVPAAAVIALAASLRYGSAWLHLLSPLTNQLRQTSSLGLPYWLDRVGVPERDARVVLVILFGLFYLWLLREAWRGARPRFALCAVSLLLTTSWLQPWYAVWAVPLAALETDRVARLGALALTGYFLWDTIPH
jgi:hypothetical protein